MPPSRLQEKQPSINVSFESIQQHCITTAKMSATLPYDPKNMIFRRLGGSGLRVSVLSFGGWLTQSSENEKRTEDLVKKAFTEFGINTFDTAEIYNNGESEVAMGKVRLLAGECSEEHG